MGDDPAPLTFTEVQAEEGLADWRMMFQTLETRFRTGDFATGLELVARIGEAARGARPPPRARPAVSRRSTCG